MSGPFQALLRELIQEGQLDSGGRFTLATAKVMERYGQLLSVHPELPWLAFLRYGYRVRARRLRCQLDLRECFLSLTGSPELQAIEQAVSAYPQSLDSDSALMHEVLWWFLAQQPEHLRLRVKSGRGHLELGVSPDEFSLQRGESALEDELELKVRWGWRGSLRTATQRAQIQQAVTRVIPFFPARIEWDGGLDTVPFRWTGRHRMLLAHLVTSQQAANLPHMALRLDMRAAHQVGRLGELEVEAAGARNCDWLVLRQKVPGQVAVVGERARLRLLFRYGLDGQPARFLPVVDGCLLQPIQLDWVSGVTVVCACPSDLKTDLTGLKLVEGPALQEFLRHLRERWIEEIESLKAEAHFDLGPLGEALQLGRP